MDPDLRFVFNSKVELGFIPTLRIILHSGSEDWEDCTPRSGYYAELKLTRLDPVWTSQKQCNLLIGRINRFPVVYRKF